MQQQSPPSWMGGADPARPAPTTFDEASMERSRSFVKALQVRRTLPDPGDPPPLPDFTFVSVGVPRDPRFAGSRHEFTATSLRFSGSG